MTKKRQVIIGLTGGFATGKTTVSRMFRSFGAKVIDADKIAHKLIKPNTAVYRKIIQVFGSSLLKKRGEIDRDKLACLVFNDQAALEKLNRIVHPEVIRVIAQEIKKSGQKEVILDAPLLIEAGLGRIVDKLIVVNLSRAQQIERSLRRSPLSKAHILKRIKAQMALEKKLRLADFVIDNNGTIRETKKQVKAIRRKLWKS